MKLRTTASLGLLLALAASQAAASARPLQLDFAPPASRASGADANRLPPALRNAPTFRPAPRAIAPTPNNTSVVRNLGQRAVQSVLESPEPAIEESDPDGRLNLHFQKRGHALKDLQKGYREMCDRVTAKIWDEPNGKRVRFDVAGKPGVGLEIPLGRARNKR